MNKLIAPLIGLIIFIILLVRLLPYDPTKSIVYADQASHYIQAQSIAYDHDLKYTPADAERFNADWRSKPQGIFLKYNGKDFYYAKPFLYSLYLVPFVAIARGKGVIIANLLLTMLLAGLIYRHFRQRNTLFECLLFLVPGLCFSQLIFYITIVHPDIFEATLLGLALTLWLKCLSGRAPRNKKPTAETPDLVQKTCFFPGSTVFWTAVIMGLSIYSKPLFILIYLPLIIRLLIYYWRWAVYFILTLGGVWLLPTLAHLTTDGTLSPYAGQRYYCLHNFPYDPDPNDPNLSRLSAKNLVEGKYSTAQTLERVLKRFHIFIRYAGENIFYYVFGRQTGMVVYQIGGLLSLLLLISFWRERRPGQGLILSVLILFILANFWAIPENYYGGTTSFGNRYNLQVISAFFLLAPRLPRGRAILVPATASAIIGGFFLLPFFPKSHQAIVAHLSNLQTFPLTLMPLERTQIYTLGIPPLALSYQEVRTVLLEKPPLQNSRLGFFLPVANSYKTPLVFPEKITRWNFLTVNGTNQPQVLKLRQAESRFEINIPPSSARLVEIKKVNPDVYWSLDFQTHFIPFWWLSPKCWEKDVLYTNSPELGVYVHPLSSEISVRQKYELSLQDEKNCAHLLFGWINFIDAPPWDNGRWAGNYKISTIYLTPEKRKDYKLTIRARTPIPGQQIQVKWNNTELGVFSPDIQSTVFECKVSASLIGRNEVDILWLNHKLMETPKKYIKESKVFPGCTALYEYIALVPQQ